MLHRFAIPAVLVVTLGMLLPPDDTPEKPIQVRHQEGLLHGFLVLRTLEGKSLADGDLTQVTHGNQVTTHFLFHFKDGSVHDETTVYSQRGSFRLLKYHLVQNGPAFEHPTEVLIDTATRQVTIHYTEDGKEKVATDRLDLPSSTANGLVPILLKNISPDAAETKVAMVAAAPKALLVKLAITPEGEEAFSVGSSSRKATKYAVKVEIGGLKGLIAPLLGKQPPDTHVWILGGDAPAFIKSEGPLFLGGPVWRIELVSPMWPQTGAGEAKEKDKTSH